MKHLHTFEGFLNEVATPRLLKSAGQNLARHVKDKKNYTVDQLKDRLMSTPIARMLSDDEILIVLDHAKEELGMNESATNEGLSDEAITLHAMLRCGQDSAQNFIDDNGIDPKKLMEYIRVNPDKKIDVKDYICGTSGTVGSNKGLLQRFIKELKK